MSRKLGNSLREKNRSRLSPFFTKTASLLLPPPLAFIFLLPLMISLSISLSSSCGYCSQGRRVNLGLTGRFGYSGAIRCLEIYHSPGCSQLKVVGQPSGAVCQTEAVCQTFAYCGTQEGLLIIDLTDSASPRPVSFFELGSAQAIRFYQPAGQVGEFALILKTTGELIILSIDDPEHPVYAGCFRPSETLLSDTPRGLCLFDHYLCLASGSSGLLILDLSDPTKPAYAGRYHSAGQVEDVAIFGRYACVADGPRGLAIIDLSDPSKPRYAGGHPIDLKEIDPQAEYKKNASFVAIYGHYACLGLQSHGVAILDLAEPANPSLVSLLKTQGEVKGIAVADHYAYLADDAEGLVIVDLEHPEKPAKVFNEPPSSQSSQPKETSQTAAGAWAKGAWDVAVSGHLACIVRPWGEELTIFTLQNLTVPSEASSYYTKGYAKAVAVCGHHALLADGCGLSIVKVDDPAKPTLTGRCPTAGSASNLAVVEPYAYVADAEGGLVVIDIADPKNPRQVGGYQAEGMTALDVAIYSHYAYVAADSQGLLIFDLSDPAHPRLTGGCDTEGNACGLAISGPLAYVADWTGLAIIDIHDPSHPSPIGRYYQPGMIAKDVALSGHYALVAGGASGLLLIIDISDPKNPYLVASQSLDDGQSQATATASYQQPNQEGGASRFQDRSALRFYVQQVAVSGRYAYLAAGEQGLVVVDMADPQRPLLCGQEATMALASGVAIDAASGYAHVAEAEGGLSIYRIIDSPPPQGNLIILPTGPALASNSLWPPCQALANLAYSTFLDQNFNHYDLFYLSPDPYQDIDHDGFPNPLVVRKAAPSASALEQAFSDWAITRLNTGPLYLYLPGQGSGQVYQILPGETVKSNDPEALLRQEDNSGSLKAWLDNFQQQTGREVICLMEFSSSGSFAARLMDANTASFSRTIITCTDSGPSFLDPEGRFSFTGIFLTFLGDQDPLSGEPSELFSGSGPEAQARRRSRLEAIFSQAREAFWTLGPPWSSQPPQMITCHGGGSKTLLSISLSVEDEDSGQKPGQSSPASVWLEPAATITSPNQKLFLKATGHYLDGSSQDLSDRVYYRSSDPSLLRVTRSGVVYPDPNTGYSGLAYILATIIDPDFAHADHGRSFDPITSGDLPPLGGITGRIPIRIAIPDRKERDGQAVARAIIVAGRANDPAGYDYLAESITQVANYAYDTFRARGYSPQSICYLNHDQSQPGAVQLEAGQTFTQVLNRIFTEPADNPFLDLDGLTDLTILLIDHGRKNTFFLGPTSDQVISPPILDQWLDSLQKRYPSARVTVIIDACYAGDFVDPLIEGAEKRTAIASTDKAEAFLAADGLVCLTAFLMPHLRAGVNLHDAFEQARCELASVGWGALQQPVLKSSQDSPFSSCLTYLGRPFVINQDQPQILQASWLSDPNQPLLPRKPITLWAKVADLDGIDSVFALISNSQAAVQFSASPQDSLMTADLARVDLVYNPALDRYEGVYEGFPSSGPYTVLFMAKDSREALSYPKAIYPKVWGESQDLCLLVYEADCLPCAQQVNFAQWVLEKRGVPKQNIVKVCGTEALLSHLASLARDYFEPPSSLINHLLIFLTPGESNMLERYGEALSQRLDQIQKIQGCTIISLIEASDADKFLPLLKGRERITIALNHHLSSGSAAPSFWHFFFSGIYRGLDLYRAWQAARLAVSYFPDQALWPLLDDNGNGQALEYGQNYDGRLASRTYLGSPFEPVALAAPQIILPSSSSVYLEAGEGAPIQVRVQETTARVFALISAPDGSIDSTDLVYDPESGWFKAVYTGFTQVGIYRVFINAQDRSGLTDLGEICYIVLMPDKFENDNRSDQAKTLLVNQPPQEHSFHSPADEDWSSFWGYAGLPYEVRVNRMWLDGGLKIDIQAPDGSQINPSCDPNDLSYDTKSFIAPQNGLYLVRIACQGLPAVDYPAYQLSVICPVAGTGGVFGWVRDANTGEGIVGATICTPAGQCTSSLDEWWSQDPAASIRHVEAGFYFMDALPKQAAGMSITAQAIGYLPQSKVIFGYDENILNLTFYLQPDPKISYQKPAQDPVAVQRMAGIMEQKSSCLRVKVPLSEGFNLFSHPNADPRSPYDILDFLLTFGQINHTSGPCFSSIRYLTDSSSSGSRETKACFFLPPTPEGAPRWSINCSDHFPMASGKGYAVYLRRPLSFDFPLSLPNPPIDLRRGENWVGIPSPPAGYSSYLMLQDIGSASEVSSICGFDPESGRWKITYWHHGQPSGDNFPIRSGLGYLVYIIGDKPKWLPGKED
ncbi:MAG: hypothetical protein K6U11_05840 [bacterium]|nr:hypothetical protein [bacterium]